MGLLTATAASRVVAPALDDARIRKMSFTGSTAVGRKLVEQCAPNLQRMSMELGGNAPFLAFEDTSLDAAVKGAVTAKMRNNGESCVAANRFHVHESVAAEFTRRLTAEMDAMKIGHGTEDGAQVGPLISIEQRDKVVELVADALDHGAH